MKSAQKTPGYGSGGKTRPPGPTPGGSPSGTGWPGPASGVGGIPEGKACGVPRVHFPGSDTPGSFKDTVRIDPHLPGFEPFDFS